MNSIKVLFLRQLGLSQCIVSYISIMLMIPMDSIIVLFLRDHLMIL
jgi:hypothetical protein